MDGQHDRMSRIRYCAVVSGAFCRPNAAGSAEATSVIYFSILHPERITARSDFRYYSRSLGKPGRKVGAEDEGEVVNWRSNSVLSASR